MLARLAKQPVAEEDEVLDVVGSVLPSIARIDLAIVEFALNPTKASGRPQYRFCLGFTFHDDSANLVLDHTHITHIEAA